MALKNFKINDVTLTTKDGKDISLLSGLFSTFVIRENIFSPYMTAEIQITDADGLFYNQTDTKSYINGGEKINIRVETENNISGKIDTYETNNEFYVDTTTPIITKSNRQSGLLRLVTKEAIVNQLTRLGSRYDGTIEETIRKIILEDKTGLQTKKNYNKYLSQSDYKTINKYSFIANLEKPFDVIRKLCPKAVPSSTKEKFNTAGYFFFENFDGLYFVGIDTLLKGKLNEKNESLKSIYNKIETSKGEGIPYFRYVETVDDKIPSDLRILNQPIVESKSDLINSLMSGMYGVNVTEFDSFTFERTETNLTLRDIYQSGLNHTEESRTSPDFPLFDGRKFSRRIYRIRSNHAYGVGTNLDDSLIDPKDISRYQAQSIVRSKLLFSQIVSIEVPLNFNLKVGQIIYCEMPNATTGTTKEPDVDRFSGKYLITALCHDMSFNQYNTRVGITKLQLVKDSYKDPKVK